MNPHELFASMGEHFNNFLHCGLFTTDSLEGWLCIFILGFFLWSLGKKALKFVSWSCAVIFLIQVFYWLSFTSLNDKIPLSSVFRYDVLGSIAGCFEDARIAEILNKINEYIRSVMTMTWDFISGGELKSTVDGLLSPMR